MTHIEACFLEFLASIMLLIFLGWSASAYSALEIISILVSIAYFYAVFSHILHNSFCTNNAKAWVCLLQYGHL